MSLANGYIHGLLNNGAGLDHDGDPAPLSNNWSDPIPANIEANNQSTKGTSDGSRFTVAKYTVIVDGLDVAFTRVKLVMNTGEFLGEFDVQSVERLTFVMRTKLTV